MTPQKSRRRQLLMPGRYQRAWLRMAAVHWLLLCGTALTVVCLLEVLLRGLPYGDLSGAVYGALGRGVVICLVCLCLLPKFLYDTLQLSHRAAGPLYKLGQALDAVGQGAAPQPIQLRKGDFFEELVAQYNRAVDRWPALAGSHAPVAPPPAAPPCEKSGAKSVERAAAVRPAPLDLPAETELVHS